MQTKRHLSGPLLTVGLVCLCGIEACSSGSGGDTTPTVTLTGEYVSGPIAQYLGIGSYDVASAPGVLGLRVYGVDGVELGQATVQSAIGGDLTVGFFPVAPETQGGTLHASFAVVDPARPVQLTLEFDIAGATPSSASMRFRVRIGGGHDPLGTVEATDEWSNSAVIEADLNSPVALGVGGYRPTEWGAVAVLQLVDSGQDVASVSDVVVWQYLLGLGPLDETEVDEYLLAVLYDLEPLLAQIDAGSGSTDNKSGRQFGVVSQSAGDCAEVYGDGISSSTSRILHEQCTRDDYVGMCPIEDRVCTSYVDIPPWGQQCVSEQEKRVMLEAFTSEGCLWRHLGCAVNSIRVNYCENLPSAEEIEQFRADCGRNTICTDGLRGVESSVMLEGCDCACTLGGCGEYCTSIAAYRGLTSITPPSCADDFTCDCHFDAESFCASQLPGEFCGGGEYDAAAGGFYCPIAVCNDGVFSASCALDSSRSEICDASSPEGATCDVGYECVDCSCVPCEQSVVCGDGRVSRGCPGLEEECDGFDVGLCPDGFYCAQCSCIENTCEDGVLWGDEECNAIFSCPTGEHCVDCQCVTDGPDPGGDPAADAGSDTSSTGEVIGSCVGYFEDGAVSGCITYRGSLPPGSDESSFAQSNCLAPLTWSSGIECPIGGQYGECRHSDTTLSWSIFYYVDIGLSPENQTATCEYARSVCESSGDIWFGTSC